jgi:hypothetical protein
MLAFLLWKKCNNLSWVAVKVPSFPFQILLSLGSFAPKPLQGGADVVPAMSLLVIMAAVPPETGVGSMTPNWTLLAALDEAIYRQMGPNYELRVVPIASHLDGLLALYGH